MAKVASFKALCSKLAQELGVRKHTLDKITNTKAILDDLIFLETLLEKIKTTELESDKKTWVANSIIHAILDTNLALIASPYITACGKVERLTQALNLAGTSTEQEGGPSTVSPTSTGTPADYASAEHYDPDAATKTDEYMKDAINKIHTIITLQETLHDEAYIKNILAQLKMFDPDSVSQIAAAATISLQPGWNPMIKGRNITDTDGLGDRTKTLLSIEA